MSLDKIKDYVEQRLKCSFICIDDLIMSAENIINQTVFEVYYDEYLKFSPSMTLREFALQNSFEAGFDAFYKKVQRDYQLFREHKDNQFREIFQFYGVIDNNTVYDNIQYLKLSEIEEKLEGHKLKKYQIFQMIRLMNYDIFKSIKTGTICDSNKKKSTEVIELLRSVNDIYKEINESQNMIFFEKGVQYYQLETSVRYEFFYHIIKLLRKVEGTLKSKGLSREYLKSLIAIRSENEIYENRFILGYNDYFEKLEEEKKSETILKAINKIAHEIFYLSKFKSEVKREIKNQFNFNNSSFENKDVEKFVKNYIGMGQHILKDKLIEKSDVKHYRELFKSTL